MNKLRLRELAEKFHLPYSVAKKIVKGIKGRGVSIVRMRNEPSNVGYRGWGDAPVAKIERGSKRSPFADLLHEAGHVDAGHLGSKANRGSDLLKGAEGSYPRAHHESGGDILSAARSVLLKEKQANRAAGKILKDSGASPEQISAFAQEQRKNFRTYRKNAWRHAVAGERIKNPSATESNVMGVLQRQAERRGVTPSDGALRSARESVQRQIRMNPINRGRDPIFNNESFGVDGSKSILPLTISEAKRIHKNTSKLWRVREFARGDYAIPALGKMLRDRSFLEQFATGKRGPKMGDLRVFRWGQVGENRVYAPQGSWFGTESVIPAMKQTRSGIRQEVRIRQEARNQIAKMLRKGRVGGDVYEHIDRRYFSAKLRLRELARGDYAIPALGKMLKDRSFLEQFLTGKRGPKMGDLVVGKVRMTKRLAFPGSPVDVSVSKVMKTPAGKGISGDMERIRDHNFRPAYWGNQGIWITNQTLNQARQRARDQVAKMIRKGRAGGDVYEELAAKLRLREFSAVEWTPQAKAVWRHYFKKAKKQMRGGRFGADMDGYLPGDRLKSPFGLMWRGANKGEVEKLGTEGRFVSNWSHFSKPGAKRTYVAGGPRQPEGYALTAAAYSDRGALQAARMGHHTDAASEGFEKARIYGIAPSALKRSDNKIRSHIGSYASTAPLRGGIGAKEVRVLLKPTGKKGDSVRWRPAPLGEVMRRDFESAKLRLRELALGAGTRLRHIPLNERKNIVERLSKIIGEKPPALEGRVPPRMIRVGDKDFILHYRGANKSRDLKRPYRRFRESIEAIVSGEPPRNMNFKEKQKHFREATSKRDREDWAMANTIGTSTNPQIAKHFRKNHSGSRPGLVGVYATPIEKIPQRIQEGKIGFPGRGHPFRNHWEQEISQQNGGNLVKVRQYRSIDEDNADDVGLPVKTIRGWSESRRIRDFSAKLRLREFGLLGHPLEYSRPYIYGDRRLPRGEGEYETPEAFRLNNQGESFARGQEAAIAKARKGGVISVGLKKTTKGGWRAIAQENGLTRAADAKRSVLRHELIHSIQRAKAASQGKSYVRGMMNPIKRYVAEVGAYAAENRRRPGRGLVERLFPTFKAVLSAKASM